MGTKNRTGMGAPGPRKQGSSSLVPPRMILVRPQLGENIGASARAMWNFGLDRLTLIAPRDGWPNPAAGAMASGAGRVLDEAVIARDVDEAVGDLHLVFATTARMRDMSRDVLTPSEAMRRAHLEAKAGRRVGVLFGPERAGLENADLEFANIIVEIQANPDYSSLNLAQAVLLLAYEWRLACGEGDEESAAKRGGSAEAATHEERRILINTLEERLGEKGFFWPEEKADHMRLGLRNLFARIDLSKSDLKLFHGIFRALARSKPLPNKTEEERPRRGGL